MKETISVKLLKVIFFMAVFLAIFLCTTTVRATDKTLIFPLPQQIQITEDFFISDETLDLLFSVKAEETQKKKI